MLFFHSNNKAEALSVSLKPNSSNSKEGMLGFHPDWLSHNLHGIMFLRSSEWTKNGDDRGDHHSVIEFLDLKTLTNVKIIKAELIFHDGSVYDRNLNSSWDSDNTTSVFRIIEDWDKELVNGSNPPAIDSSISAEIPRNNNNNDLKIADVTALVQIMVDNPETSFGFYLKQKDPTHYRSMVFASSFVENSEEHPELRITYI